VKDPFLAFIEADHRVLCLHWRGDWRLSRRVRFARGGGCGVMDGHARFVSVGAHTLCYEERGELRLEDATQHACFRRQRYRFARGCVTVCFDDGALLCELAFRQGLARGQHRCGRDRYELRLEWLSASEFFTRWVVTGPQKDGAIETVYRRVDPSPPGPYRGVWEGPHGQA